MPRFRLRTLFIAIAVFAITLTIYYHFQNWFEQLAFEYVTADTIRDVAQFVESHNGKWPQNWNDIPNGEHASRHVRMRFDVSAEELATNPEAIYDAITPMSGKYFTYPHAELDLAALRDIVLKYNPQ